MNKIIIGSRGSLLALWQAEEVAKRLRQIIPGYDITIKKIKTEGDRDQNSSLTKIGGQGVFTKQIERSLIREEIDIAVHSLKDLPSEMPEELILAAVPERGQVCDVLISTKGYSLMDLPANALIGSGSIRRRALLHSLRPDLRLSDLRGNIHTRLEKLTSQNMDAIIMAGAAVERLGIKSCKYTLLERETFIPAVGQGAIGIQTRRDHSFLNEQLSRVNHTNTFLCVSAERAFLKSLDSGCQFPVGATAFVENNQMNILGFVSSINGKVLLNEKIKGDKSEAEQLGTLLAEQLIEKGALELLNK